MARLVDKPQRAEDQQDDLEVLHPERYPVIAGQPLEVREYGFVEGLRLRRQMTPFLDGLYQVMNGGADLSVEEVLLVIGDHIDDVFELVAVSAGVERDWIETLPPEDGELLVMAWWGVNGPFFVRQLQSRLLTEAVRAHQRNKMAGAAAGATSTPPSSPPDTTPPGSATTPNVN